MIKYLEYDSLDETGQHITPINNLYQLNKTASGSYSPEIMKVILGMKKREDRYYVVINALGSVESWGCNKNGDAFPVSGLSHKSYRTDMSTINDYGYKTFEYYGHFFKHHVNDDPVKSFGEVVFSHWNNTLQRVELIVALNKLSGSDIIDALEKGEVVCVSMGCKVRYDRCSICDNKAKTREQYCKHLREYMRYIVDHDMAKKWSRETGRIIRPGMQVFAYNDYPRFFDISKVNIGADKTAFVLGKAANKGNTKLSIDIADAYGIKDSDFDKIAETSKKSDIEKEIDGGISPDDIDGRVVKIKESEAMRKALDEKMQKAILEEPMLPQHFLDVISKMPIKNIFSTMLGMGIMPKPAEFQRIIIVKAGGKEIADELERKSQVFDYDSDAQPLDIPISNIHFSDALGKAMTSYLKDRSCACPFIQDRLNPETNKEAAYSSTEGNDYWLEESKGSPISEMTTGDAAKILTGLASLYAGLKLKALGYGPKQLAEIFVNKPWLRTMLGGGVVWKIQDSVNKLGKDHPDLIPASEYEGMLQDTNFSGHVKVSGLVDALILPNAYIFNSVKQAAYVKPEKYLFHGVGEREKTAGLLSGNNSILNKNSMDALNSRILQLI